jgi:hypothetical protein
VFNYATLGVRSDLDFSSNVNFSVAFWVRSTTLGSLPFIANTPSFSYGGYNLSPNGSGGWHWSLQDAAGNTAQASGTNQLSDGSWHHLAFTFDRQGSGATYIDGAQVDSRPIAGLLGRIPPNRMCIGQNAGGSYTTFNPAAADIDDVGLWRRVLMPFEVTGIYLVGASNGLSFVSAPVTLSIQPVGNNVQLIWSGGLLQSADDVAGPYVDVPGATTPYTVMPSALKKFYRIRE